MQTNLLTGAKQYPVVTVLGPRQSGKSTLVKESFPEKPYLNLEDPDIRHYAETDPRAFLTDHPDGCIIDEIQHVPQLLSYIQTTVDKTQRAGRYILTGSQQLELNASITQSLAGRTDIIKLLPLSLSEVNHAEINLTLNQQLLRGFYPKLISDSSIETQRYYRNYFNTYVQRDVKSLLNVKNATQFEKFIRLCSGRIGQLFNASQLASEVGVSSQTIHEWTCVLEASFIIFRLKPFFTNTKKRLTKTPKLYFYDVGLACYLLDIHTETQIARDPLRGALFENLVTCDLLKAEYNQGKEGLFYFYRDSNQHEIDLLQPVGRQFNLIEIKSSQTFHPEFIKNLSHWEANFKPLHHQSYVISASSAQTSQYKGCQLLNYLNASATLTYPPMH